MRSTLNSFVVDFTCDAPTNYARIASVSLITGIHLTHLENALVIANELGTADVEGGGINHIVDCIHSRPDHIRFRIYNRYETRDGRANTPCIL